MLSLPVQRLPSLSGAFETEQPTWAESAKRMKR